MNAKLDREVEVKTIRAFNKLLWIQNDLFARHYVVDGWDLYEAGTKTESKVDMANSNTTPVTASAGVPHRVGAWAPILVASVCSMAIGAFAATRGAQH